MNRIIKFRAWDKKNEIFVDTAKIGISLNGVAIAPTEVWLKHDLANLILMQFTGLKDKNGKEIYEGDIVQTNEGNWIAQVIFDDGMFMCVNGGFSTFCQWSTFEIIGNIYENKELLEDNNAKNKKKIPKHD